MPEKIYPVKDMEFWKKKKVLVTGATGFLGSWLVQDLLSKGAEVTTIIRDTTPSSNFFILGLHKKVNIVMGTIVDIALVTRTINEYSIDTIFHLAAQSQVSISNKSPLSTFETNIKGTWVILEAARELNVERIIVASSDKAYGPQAVLPYVESSPLGGTHPYDVSKSCVDLIARSYFSTYQLPVVVIRASNLYGGGDNNYARLIPKTIKHILNNESPIIQRSNGTPIRDFLYISDSVRGYISVAENMDNPDLVGQAFNIGSGKGMNKKDVVEIIIKQMNSNLTPVIVGESKLVGEINTQYLSSEKILKILGWKPEYSFEDGLAETINWYENNLS